MTAKQERILQTALHLFAERGYHATPTSLVAREAGVSEGLIFRHFQNKEGLLEAILEMGRERAEAIYNSTFGMEDPRAMLRALLSMPFGIDESEYPFWKLVYSLKWQTDKYDDGASANLRNALTHAFTKLEYGDPEAEAELVMILTDGIATAILLRNVEERKRVLRAILDKYDL